MLPLHLVQKHWWEKLIHHGFGLTILALHRHRRVDLSDLFRDEPILKWSVWAVAEIAERHRPEVHQTIAVVTDVRYIELVASRRGHSSELASRVDHNRYRIRHPGCDATNAGYKRARLVARVPDASR